jgi:hypothetical protein
MHDLASRHSSPVASETTTITDALPVKLKYRLDNKSPKTLGHVDSLLNVFLSILNSMYSKKANHVNHRGFTASVKPDTSAVVNSLIFAAARAHHIQSHIQNRP